MNTEPALRMAFDRGGIECNQIAEGLYQGSYPPEGSAVARAGFDVVVFCADEMQPSADRYPGVTVVHCPLDDSGKPMTNEEWWRACARGQLVARRLQAGARVLVTCMAGRNRSGLVTALALYHLDHGQSGREIVRLIRKARQAPSGPALSNPWFVDALAVLP